MNYSYLLDTNILSDLVRNPQGEVADKITQVGEDQVCTSVVVASELRFGARKHRLKTGSERLFRQVEAILSAIEILAFDQPTDQHYAEIREALETAGTPIGPNDLLIAAHARAHGLTLVTANEGEFARVPGIKVENWLAPASVK